jgi:hypothetical protein
MIGSGQLSTLASKTEQGITTAKTAATRVGKYSGFFPSARAMIVGHLNPHFSYLQYIFEMYERSFHWSLGSASTRGVISSTLNQDEPRSSDLVLSKIGKK